jgi:YVTN family beta-propeller protein
MKINKLLLTALAGSLFFVSCNNDDDATPDVPQGAYDNGVLVLNQGGFNIGNASVSYISDAFALQNNIFAANNPGATLGDTGQDLGLNGDYAYIVLNNSNKIEVVNRYTFTRIATIEDGLINPRYITFYNNKGYVTNWGDGLSTTDDYVAVIDLATNAVTATIPVAEGPERIIEENGKLYVSHYGGFGIGNSVTVINAATNSVQTTIVTGDAPKFMVVEDNVLYILSEGSPSWAGAETAGELQKVNLATNLVIATIDFPQGSHPSNLVEEDDTLYYTVDSGIYTLSPQATALPAAPVFTTTPQGAYGIYSFDVEDNNIYIGDAGNYSENGKVYIYSLTGTLQNSYTVGVIPAGFYFND